jgi:uncharacterized membrane protein
MRLGGGQTETLTGICRSRGRCPAVLLPDGRRVENIPDMAIRLLSTVILLGAMALSLASCRRERKPPVLLTVAHGTEPFWAVEVRSDRMLFTRLGADSLFYPYAPASVDPDGRLVYRSIRFGADTALILVIERGDCSDGMSDQHFPAFGTLVHGGVALRGCATAVPDTTSKR